MSLWAGSSVTPRQKSWPASRASAFLRAIASEPALKIVRIVPRAIIASRSSSLSILMPLKTTSFALQAFLHRAFELAGDVVAEGDALHRQRHDRAGGVEAAGGEGFVDIDRRDFFGQRIGEGGELRRDFRQGGLFGLPEDRFDVVAAHVLQHEDAAGRGGGDLLGDVRLDRVRRLRRASLRSSGTSQPRISPSRAATLASEPIGLSGCLRPRWPKMICFQPRLRPNSSVSFIDRRRMSSWPTSAPGLQSTSPRTSTGVPEGTSRATRARGIELQVVGEAQVFARVEAFEDAAELQDAVGGDGHGDISVGGSGHAGNQVAHSSTLTSSRRRSCAATAMPERTRLGTKRASSPRCAASCRRSPPVTKICGGWSSWAEMRCDRLRGRRRPRPRTGRCGWRLRCSCRRRAAARRSARAPPAAAGRPPIEGFGRHAKAGQDHAAFEGAVGGDQIDRDGRAGADDDRRAAGIAQHIGRDGSRQAIEADALGKIDAHDDRQIAIGRAGERRRWPMRVEPVGENARAFAMDAGDVPAAAFAPAARRRGSRAAPGRWETDRVSRGVGRSAGCRRRRNQPIFVELLPISTAISGAARHATACRWAASSASTWRTS